MRTRVVSPGANDEESGNALRSAIASITDGKAWRVKLEPGIYALGSTALRLKPGISLEGSGEEVTIVHARVDAADAGTLVGVSGSQVSQLTVENNGGGVNSIALYSEEPTFAFHDITAIARNGSSGSYAIYVKGAQGTFERVHASAFSSGSANGFRCRNCSARLQESTSEARGGPQGLGRAGDVSLRHGGSRQPRRLRSRVWSVSELWK